GDLLAGGEFSSVNGIPASNLARWDGAQWSPLNLGVNGPVHAITVLPAGRVVVGGLFTQASEQTVANIALWNGTQWSALGSGLVDHSGSGEAAVQSLATTSTGEVVAVGFFDTAGGLPADHVAIWNGSAWRGVSVGFESVGTSYASAVMPNADLVVGGDFDAVSGVRAARIARWDGAAWFSLGTGVDARVRPLAVRSNGDVVAGGDFTNAGGVAASRIAIWNGGSWSPLPSG